MESTRAAVARTVASAYGMPVLLTELNDAP